MVRIAMGIKWLRVTVEMKWLRVTMGMKWLRVTMGMKWLRVTMGMKLQHHSDGVMSWIGSGRNVILAYIGPTYQIVVPQGLGQDLQTDICLALLWCYEAYLTRFVTWRTWTL